MHSLAVAEWILSLVMGEERASAVLGDLVESATGPLDLWFSVLNTFFGSLFRQVFDSVGMASIAKDFVLTAADLSTRYALRFLSPVLVLYILISTWPQLAPIGDIAGFLGTLLRLAITLVVPWKTGRMVAERYPGRELPAFVAVCVTGLALGAIASAVGTPWNSILREDPWILLRWNQIPTPWNPGLTLISMILVRRRWLAKEGTPA